MRGGAGRALLMASRLEAYLHSVIDEPPRPGPIADALRILLGGLEGLYGAGLAAYLLAERLGLRRRGRLPVPVVSIGNLSVGGTGKTPMTQWLVERLQEEGRRVAVLSRGHGGSSQSVRLVSDDAGNVLLSARDAGDEPHLLAATLPGTPILVGKDRRESGRAALRRFDLDVLVLDDGFQFWQLARDLDIVLLDARRPFANGHALPRGLLREPKQNLRRAEVVVATRAGELDAAARAALIGEVARLAPYASVFFADHRAVGFVPAHDLSAPFLPLERFQGRPVSAACAIARPDSFRQTLERDAGTQVLGITVWDDHHPLTGEDAARVLADAARAGAEAVVVTEKDAVKWAAACTPDAGLPVYALRVAMAVEEEAGLLAAVNEKIAPRPPILGEPDN